MWFSLDIIRARKGDCLILHYGTSAKPFLMLIDGGPRGVYRPHLKPRLEQIKRARGIADNKPIPVDLLMVSHIDDDHIQGILDLTRDLIQDDRDFARIFSFWHNSFENIIDGSPDELTSTFTDKFGTASMNGDPSDLTLDVDEEIEEVVVSNLKVFASIAQGAQLRSDVIDGLRSELNPDFEGHLIQADGESNPFEITDGLKFTVVGPMAAEVEKLRKDHQSWLKDLKKEGKSAEDVLTAYIDKSVSNLSSIVGLAEAEGKKILLTGDARGDKVLKGLELVGLVETGGNLHVDVLKVPHHGSANNLEKDFFKRITARHYVFSGNGEHGNPERESLEMLLQARGDADDYIIHLTYPVDEIDAARKIDWEKEQSKERKKKEKKPDQKIREDWFPQKHSLESLFDEHPNFGKKVSIVGDDEPHVINLLDELGF